ncbi:MAG: radical SAM protein [Bacilli bacterium]|nr:radical SAM protein [Bacilli bacterium]
MAKLTVEELIVEITRACTLDCKHCFRGESQNAFMDLQTIRNLFGNVEYIKKLVLSGGEPFLAIQQMNEVADLIRRYNIRVDEISIITNGTVLTTDVIRALEKLQMVCGEFNIRVSDDKFHMMALDKKGLMNRRNVNFDLLSKIFGATKYGTPRKETILSLIENVGRARNLTQDDMDEVNSYGDYQTYYTLSDSSFFGGADLTLQFKPPYYAGSMLIKSLVNIDVNGYLTDSYASYEDADSHNIDGCNINYVTLLEAVRNNSERVAMVKEKRL